MGFTYDEEIAKIYEISDIDWQGCFVNCNSPNYSTIDAYDFGDKAQVAFLSTLKQKGISYDAVDTICSPVFIVLLQSLPIAWYDLENMCGYISKT